MGTVINFIHNFVSQDNKISCCELTILPELEIVIATEIMQNFGTSLNGAAEELANEVADKFGFSKEKIIWIHQCQGYFYIIRFIIYNNKFVGPEWNYIDGQIIEDILHFHTT